MPKKLRTEPRLALPDDLYAELVELHRGLGEEEARLVDAKLILLLANHIGDMDVLREAIAAARGATKDAKSLSARR
jgi:hypothetical protein